MQNRIVWGYVLPNVSYLHIPSNNLLISDGDSTPEEIASCVIMILVNEKAEVETIITQLVAQTRLFDM